MVVQPESPDETRWRPLVLVADDDTSIGDLIAIIIHQLGLEALTVGDGAAAVQQVAAHGPALCGAFIDLHMPVLDGLATTHAIRQIAPDLRIVLMSASFPMLPAVQITSLRVAHLLRKPFPLREIQALIRSFRPCRRAPGVPV